MSELDDFLTTFVPRQMEADKALHDGDPEPRMALWSRNDPMGSGRSFTATATP